MSKEGEKAAVFRTTKVRNKLKDDGSWLQRRPEPKAETEEEKPWLAELRARRVNGAADDTSPVTSPTKSTPSPTKSATERAPTSGYLIRGVFTKLDKPASSSTSNGFAGTTQFTKKPSETYKKIASHTLRSTENQEDQLSKEEKEKRTEAASSVLKRSTVRQRSYVLSAAKKYESKEEAPDPSLDNSSVSFVAKRVEIIDDDESAATPAPASTPPPSTVVPVTSVASAPQPKPRKTVDITSKTAVDVAVNEPVAPKEIEAAPEPVREDPPPVLVTEKDPFEHMTPGCTKVATPLAVLLPEYVQAVSTEPEPEESDLSGQADTPLIELAPALPMSPTPASPTPESPVPVSAVREITVITEPGLEPEPEPEQEPSPKPRVDITSKTAVDVAVNEPVAPKEIEAVPEPVREEPVPPVLVTEKDPFEHMTPGCTKVATPLPVLLPEYVQAVSTEPEPEESDLSGQADTPLIELAPALPTPMSPTPASPTPESPGPVSAVREITVMTEPEPEPEPEQEREPSPKPNSGVDTLTALSDTLISFNTSSTSVADDEPVLAEKEGSSVDSHPTENGVEQEPTPELSNCVPMTDDLLALCDGPEPAAEPVPPSPGRWSQDLLSGLDSEPNPAKTSNSLDLLANDVIVFNTEARSPTETVTITTNTVIITDTSEEDNADPWSSPVTTTVTESSSADPFDPYPIGTTSPNSSSDLLQPLSDISLNRVSTTSTEIKDPSPETNLSSNALESLADDIIPINTDSTSLLTRRSWATTWDTSTPEQTTTVEESEDDEPGQDEAQTTLIMFERKSTENDSPWDRWTSPTVYTVTTTTGEEEEDEEEEEESPEDTQTQTVTTITTIREIHSEPESAMDRTVIEEDQQVQTPEPEAKKGFVFVKEYVNATETSLHNARDLIDDETDYFTSSSTNHSYSSPSTYSSGSLSSTCTYCGEPVGNDCRISIEHLNINCHPACFKCGVCSKPMGDLLDSMFLHGGEVNCESCYSKAFD
ncbi:zinc finger protein 185 isoform X2 [Larimichthys crocea]|uniref:zinc finger protein 185 isoform X2 n=1 Tax=Larimichthys crocea TaxID=215358 RepID=UPI000F5F6ABC|nr:zinc finger protein 185 isoform X2 [Larimichthys crocea]